MSRQDVRLRAGRIFLQWLWGSLAIISIASGALFLQPECPDSSTPTLAYASASSPSGTFDGGIGSAVTPGAGTFKFLTGEEYKGSWLNYQIDGVGEMRYPGVGTYSGEYSEGKREGQGTFTWDNGDSYTGSWKSDSFDGTGTYLFSDGAKITGTFTEGVITSGTYFFSNSTGRYAMSFKDGEVTTSIVTCSKGSYTFNYTGGDISYASLKLKSGLTYAGGIKNGLVNGSGTLTYPNGNTYKGTFKLGKKNGSGTFKWTKKKASYNGKWANDKMSGKGTYFYPKKAKGYKLVGKFKNGKPTGYCTYYASKSRHYKTKWSNGKCVKIWE